MSTTVNMFELFETDTELENAGVDIVYGQNSRGEDIVVRVARAGGANPRFAKVHAEVTKPYRRQLDAGKPLPKELQDALNRKLYAQAVVLKMAGFEERDGTPIATSTPEQIEHIFERLPNLLTDIMVQASSLDLFRTAVAETASGN